MNILITGGTGFIGSPLCSYLSKIGHNLVVKTRHINLVNNGIKTINDLQQLSNNDIFHVVINLAGQPIADKRWSKIQKEKILRSRIDTTKSTYSIF